MIDVVGIGDDGWVGLDDRRRSLVTAAATLIGGERHLDLVRARVGAATELVAWPRPLRPGLTDVLAAAHAPVVVLASGDPLRSGIGTTLIDLLGADEVRIHPSLSSDALARARQGWSAESSQVVTIVGRDPRSVLPYLSLGARLIVLCSGGDDPARLGALLTERGWGESTITARWHLGSEAEGALSAPADRFAEGTADLVVACIEVRCSDPSVVAVAGPAPGRAEDFITHDGQITKAEVRASALARLRPMPGAHLWDLGAGHGSVALEWCLAADRARATCVERDANRADRIGENAAQLGLGGRVEVVVGDHHDTAKVPASPVDAIFVGGGVSDEVLERAWSALTPGGRLVAHAVTLEGESVLVAARERLGGELTRLTIERATPLGRYLSWSPARAVVQLATLKGQGSP